MSFSFIHENALGDDVSQEGDGGHLKLTLLPLDIKLVLLKLGEYRFHMADMALSGPGIYQYVIYVGDYKFS